MIKKLILPFVPTAVLILTLLWLKTPLERAGAGPTDVTPLPPVTDPDGRLGVAYGFYENPEGSGQRPYLDLMYDAGARHDRWDFRWTAIQPDNQSQWNWSGEERIVRAENTKGVNVLGILLWTPQWASTYNGLAGWIPRLLSLGTQDARMQVHAQGPLAPDGFSVGDNYPPKNLNQPVFVDGAINPSNYWGYYVYNVAKHFDGATAGDPLLKVNAWEVWNEPEWNFFWINSPTATEDYCTLLKVAYQAIKGDGTAQGGNPDATVLFGGLHYWINPQFYKDVLTCLAADPSAPTHNYYFDAMSVHFYSRSDNTYDRVIEIKNEMTALGMGDHPVWLTETGAPMYGDIPFLEKGDNYLSIDEEAAYVIQSYANALAAGVERYIFFRAHDADMGEPFGLIRNDQSLRPAYVAYQVLAKYLQGENQVTRVLNDYVTRVTLWGTPRGKISVLWNRTPNQVTHAQPAAMPTATLVDRWGVTQTINAISDTYNLVLNGATANLVSDPNDYIVGGDPLILIETDTVSPTSTLAPLPSVTKGAPITLTWSASDAGSGVWYTQIQASTSPDGPWTTVADWGQTQGLTQTIYTGEHNLTYYFRARARDQVGNWEPWPASYEVSTTVDADTEFRFRVNMLFNDSNSNGEWDPIDPGTLKPEITLTQVSMRFVDEEWHTVTSVISDSWHFTMTLLPGTYTFIAEWEDPDGDDWSYAESLELDGRIDPYNAPSSDIIGLRPHRYFFLPLLLSRAD